jgi:hypothetical protein
MSITRIGRRGLLAALLDGDAFDGPVRVSLHTSPPAQERLMPTPSIGRIVHYVSYGTPGGEYPSTCRAAVITEVGTLAEYRPGVGVDTGDGADAEVVGLMVANPSGVFFDRGVVHDETILTVGESPEGRRVLGHRPGTWHWPERVD